jgi:hypothetical protein
MRHQKQFRPHVALDPYAQAASFSLIGGLMRPSKPRFAYTALNVLSRKSRCPLFTLLTPMED